MALITLPRQLTVDINGEPRVGALLTVYDAGTNNTRPVYTTKAFTAELSQPIRSVEGGIFPAIYVNPTGGDFKLVIQDADGSTIYTEDNIPSQVGATDIDLVGISTQSQTTPIIYSLTRTSAEISSTVTPTNYSYAPGDVRRYGAVCDGIADDTTAINTAARIARMSYPSGQAQVFFYGPGPCRVTGSLDLSLCDVYGYGETIHIQASSAQFDVITTTGSTRLINLRVHGGWDGTTAGQTGDIVSAKATAPAYPYVLQFANCVFTHAKRCHIYLERAGYTSLHSVRCLTAGLHSLMIQGYNLSSGPSTTVGTSGKCQFSTCPNGYGVWIEYGVSIAVYNAIVEGTKGIWIGGDNRSLSFVDVYQEFGSGGKFLDWSTSSGIGLKVDSCFGGSTVIDYNANWVDVSFGASSSLLGTPAIPLANRVLNVDGTETTTSTTGGVDVTAASVSVPPGTWLVLGTLQTRGGTASGLQQVGACLTTTVGDSGLQNATATFFEGADEATYSPGSLMDQRMKCSRIYQNTTASTVTMYLRAYLKYSGAGTLAYRGMITAVKIC